MIGVGQSVLDAYCQHFNINQWAILGETRKHSIVLPRFCLYSFFHGRLGWSSTRTGHFFKRDHTTILYGIRTLCNTPAYIKQAEPYILWLNNEGVEIVKNLIEKGSPLYDIDDDPVPVTATTRQIIRAFQTPIVTKRISDNDNKT